MRYPEGLVHEHGAKAGILMHVAKNIPDMPQAPMVVNHRGENPDDFLKRADQAGIGWPRLFRSSAVAELVGYEGDFPTRVIDSYDNVHPTIRNPYYYGPYRTRESWEKWVRETLEYISFSPQRMKEQGKGEELPDEINVIVAEKSPSRYVGTYIKHPNQEDLTIMVITDTESVDPEAFSNDAERSAFTYRPGQGLKPYEGFSQNRIQATPSLVRDLEEIATWHDRIAALPEMDPSWTYQIEFGAEPSCLYQVRPFKPVQRADFNLRPNESAFPPLVIGTTPKEGLTVRVEHYPKSKYPDEKEHANSDNQPSLFYAPLRWAFFAEDLRNHKANLLFNAIGILAHKDIKAIRAAEVSALYLTGHNLLGLNQGDWVNIISDGTTIEFKKILKIPTLRVV